MNPTVKALSVGFIYPLGQLFLNLFGCGFVRVVMSEEKKNTVRHKLIEDSNYSHIKLYQAQLDESDFSINLNNVGRIE